MYNINHKPIGLDELIYFRERNRSKAYGAVISLFSKLVETEQLTKREIAFRLEKEPAQITRWLSGPSNWTLDTVSDLLRAMGCEPEHRVSPINSLPLTRTVHPLAKQREAK